MSAEIKKLTCINCPLGCSLSVTVDGGKVISVEGNNCPKGEEYGRNEVANPKRVVTSSVYVLNGERNVVSVKTKEAIAKDKIFDCIEAMRELKVEAPVAIGDVIAKDIAGTGVALVATVNVKIKKTE